MGSAVGPERTGGRDVDDAPVLSDTAGMRSTTRSFISTSAVSCLILAVLLPLFGCPVPEAPPGDTYETAIAVTGGTLVAQTTDGFNDDYQYDGWSIGPLPGLDRVYAVTVPDGWRVRVMVSPDAAYDPAIVLVQAGILIIDGSADDGSTGNAETAISNYNGSGVAKAYYIVIDSAIADGAGVFNLEVTLEPEPV